MTDSLKNPAPSTQSNRTKDKILSLDDLKSECSSLRREGVKISLCHGVFDLLHIGHIRHFKTAKNLGDILVVTITADQYVNKGPGRPAFPSELRAECLASLESVDYVAVVNDRSAAPAIRSVKPHFYVKGGEYSKAADDVTGNILIEKNIVEKFGGELHFTDDITFSSSNLLNKYMAGRDKATHTFLEKQRDSGLEKRIFSYLDKVPEMKIVIVGETIIDQYTYVAPMGKAPKENIIATLNKSEELFAGGVIAAANNLSAICPNIELITMLGSPETGENHEAFIRQQLNPCINLSAVYRPDGPTVTKQRFVEPTYVKKLFEVYQMEDSPLPANVQNQFHQCLDEKIGDADLVIINDFGHGFIDSETIELVQRKSRFLAVNAQSNAGNIGYNLISKYSKADFICIDAMEAWLAVRNKHAGFPEIIERLLPEVVDCPNIVVTHGSSGCYASKGNGESVHIPAFNNTVVDTVGAGDAFFVIAAPLLAAGADCQTAAFLGNVAGAISIEIVGHRRSLGKIEIQRYITTLLK